MAKMRGIEILFFILFLDCWHAAELHHPSHLIKGSSQQKGLKNSKFASSSHKQEEQLAKLFDDILLQVYPSVPSDEARKAEKSFTKSAMKESSSQQKGLKNSKFASSSHKQEEQLAKLFDDQNHNPSHMENILQTFHRTLGHILEEEGNKEPSLFNRAVSEQLSSVNKETLKEVKSDTQSGTVPCRQLLHFLQRNIVIAVVAVAGILVILVVLLLMLTMYTRKKQALYPPANMTYNIFIMNGKAWWQKSQEKNSKKYSGKQKQLNCDSCV